MEFLEARNHKFHKWMRETGLKCWFLLSLSVGWCLCNAFFVAETPRLARPPFPGRTTAQTILDLLGWFIDTAFHELGLYQLSNANIQRFGYVSVWFTFISRLLALLVLPGHLSVCWSLLKVKPPDPWIDEDSLASNGATTKEKGYQCTKLTDNYLHHVHCFCIRILTRGDKAAQPLVRKAVTAAVKVFKQTCTYDHLKVHIVTQTQFADKDFLEKIRLLGATEAKELFVPPGYITKNGTLFKARNICFWQDKGGVGKECDPTRSWILSLDEEAVITKSLVRSFIHDVLQSPDEPRIGYALGPALMDVNDGPISFMVKVMEARWITCHYTFIRHKIDTIENTLCFHGGAYFARANCDRAIGNDWGAASSVSDDFTVGLAINDLQIGVKHLTGWFIEGTKLNFWGYITHSARNLRGQIYATFCMNLSYYQFFMQLHRLTLTFLIPVFQVSSTIAFIANPASFLPGAPRCAALDMVIVFTIATQITLYAFGACYLDLKVKETLGCMVAGIVLIHFFNGFFDLVTNSVCLYYMLKDWKNRSFSYEMTAKPAGNKEDGRRN